MADFEINCGGGITPTGALAQEFDAGDDDFTLSLSGGITPAGTLTRVVDVGAGYVDAAGSISPAGKLTLVVTHLPVLTELEMTGGITPAGALSRESSAGSVIYTDLTGDIIPTGTLALVVTHPTAPSIMSFDGEIIPEGDLWVDELGDYSAVVFAGNIRPSGALVRYPEYTSFPAGTITPTGKLRRLTFNSWSLAAMHDMIIEQGAGLLRYFRWYDSSGVVHDLSTWFLRMDIRSSFNGTLIASTEGANPKILITKVNAVAGEFAVEIDPTDTAGFTFVTAVYDIEAYKDTTVERIVQGSVKLSREATTSV